MAENDNLIFEAYRLYLKNFEPFTYKITLANEIISIVCPKDRFPHLVGLNTIFLGEKATDSIVMLESCDEKYEISKIKRSFKSQYKKVKKKIIYFHHLEKLFNDVSFYKIYSLSGRKKGSHILLNIVDTEEINLVIDKASDSDIYRGNYIPRSYLINTRESNFGQYVSDGCLEEIIKLEQINNSTGETKVLYYNELLDKNNEEFIKLELYELNLKYTLELIELIINFNKKTEKYNSLKEIFIMKTIKSDYYKNYKTDIDNIIYEIEKQISKDNNIEINEEMDNEAL